MTTLRVSPVSPNQVHWISNNQYAAQFAATPYPGSGPTCFVAIPSHNVDASIYKNTKLTERFTLRLEADAYDVLNRAYYGTPDNFIGDAPSGSFNNFSETSAVAPASLTAIGTGTRNVAFGAKLLF